MCDSVCWYEKGLRFSCTGCGKCCSGAPGYVWVTEEEIAAMAAHLKIAIDLFVRKYIRCIDSRLALIELKNRDYDCVFLHDSKCIIYEVRPHQCKTFPWWKENLSSEESWNEAAKSCEGIGPHGKLISFETIQPCLDI